MERKPTIVILDEETSFNHDSIIKALERAAAKVMVVKSDDRGVVVRGPNLGLQAHEFGTRSLIETRVFFGDVELKGFSDGALISCSDFKERNRRKRRSRKARGK